MAPNAPTPTPPRFATVQPSGLLFYNGRLNEKHDFLALELVAGQVRLTYSTGGCSGGWGIYMTMCAQWLENAIYNSPQVCFIVALFNTLQCQTDNSEDPSPDHSLWEGPSLQEVYVSPVSSRPLCSNLCGHQEIY